LFKDLHIEPALEGLQSILGLLDQNTVTGQALKTIFEVMLNPLLDFGAESAPGIKSFFKGAIIGALHFTIALLQLKKDFKEALGPSTFGSIDPGKAFRLGIAAAVLFGESLLLGVRFAVALVGAVSSISDVGTNLYNFFSSASQAAGDFIDGIVDGIKNGAGLVIDAIRNLGSSMIKSLMNALDSHSPSRKTKAIGKGGFAGGMALGIEEGTGDVEDAAETMARAPLNATRKASASGAGGVGGARGNGQRGPITVNIYGVKDADELAEPSFLDRLVDALERGGRAAGAPIEITV
jgi:hypothetical protein